MDKNIDELILKYSKYTDLYSIVRTKPFECLASFLRGYEACNSDQQGIFVMDKRALIMPGFREFVQQYYGVSEGRWETIILDFEGSDEAAYEKFFMLYALYRRLPKICFSPLYIHVNETMKHFPDSDEQLFIYLEDSFPWFFDSDSDTYKASPFCDFGDFVKENIADKSCCSWCDALKNKYPNKEQFLKHFFGLFEKYCSMQLSGKQ